MIGKHTAAVNLDINSLLYDARQRFLGHSIRTHKSPLHEQKHFIFYHIARTGGSSVWHTLAENAFENKLLHILDVYHLASKDYAGTANEFLPLLEHSRFLMANRVLLHVHLPYNVSYLFDPADSVYATLVRDPVDRFISDVVHLQNTVNAFTAEQKELLAAGMFPTLAFPIRLAEQFLKNAPLVALLEAALEYSVFRYYYHWFFENAVLGKPSLSVPNIAVPDKFITVGLAAAVRQKFDYIGRFSALEESYHDIASLFGLSADKPFRHHINKNNSHLLVPDRHSRFRSVFKADYDLLAQLGIDFL